MKDEKNHDVPWQLVKLNQCHVTQQVHGELVLPSHIHKRYKGGWIHPPVRLILQSKKEHSDHALTIMRDSTSRNILHARLVTVDLSAVCVTKGRSGVCAWVEPYTGNLEHYLRKTQLGLSGLRNLNRETEIVLPTPILRSAMRQVFDGMKQLIVSGHYHGNFSLLNTYYSTTDIDEDEDDQTKLQVKLGNFKKKGGKYKKKLAQDWTAVRAGLNLINDIAIKLKKRYPNLDCCQLDGLISLMRNISPSNAEVAFEEMRRHPFFWGREERKKFFIGAIPLGLTKSQFCSKVKNATFIGTPWNQREFAGALSAMNDYRKSKGKKPYDIYSRVAFVRFVSGLYAHEPELHLWKKVDEIIQDECPDLCYKLYVLLPGAKT